MYITFLHMTITDNWLVTAPVQSLMVEREKQYKELGRRIEREKQLHITALKMQTKKNLLVSSTHTRITTETALI